MHSTVSDGTFSPRELVRLAANLNLMAISLTDHESLDGLDDFEDECNTLNISFVSGIEIAALWKNREVHILGYGISKTSEKLNSIILEIQENRKRRNNKIFNNLKELGYNITFDELVEEAGGNYIGRPHFASLLIKKGYFKTFKEVFSGCLGNGNKAFSQRMLPPPKEVIAAIHSAGGVAVWAHPVHRDKSSAHFYPTLKQFVDYGLDGVEAFYPEFSMPQHNMVLSFAEKLNLIVSGGSDFHGNNQPEIAMAIGRGSLNIPDYVYNKLVTFIKNI